MPIVTPGHRPGLRLSKSKVFGKKGGFGKKRSGYAGLNLTPMVDMFTIIVIYLLQNFSTNGDILFMTKEIQLPNLTSHDQLERAPVVSVSAEAVSVNGERVVDITDLTQNEMVDVPALKDRMLDEKRKIEQTNQAFGKNEPFNGLVNVQADRAVPFKILKKVMFNCALAGFTNLNFAGMQVSAAPAAAKTASNP